MPYVEVKVWEGFGPEKAKKAIQGITQVFAGMEIPASAVSIVVTEVPKSHWGVGGSPCSERDPGEPSKR